ncbi:hypothetical protein ACSFA0_25445 [Variovorax sp. LT1P1]|uniref:hypothetical protein n=1 Tax=Variovorax sp. LT1P1 TaxID=3443730 RepID=UPI003F47EB92
MTDAASLSWMQRLQDAQGRPDPCIEGSPVDLVGMDVSLSADGLTVTPIEIRNPRNDVGGIAILFDIRKSNKWTSARVSWAHVGVRVDAIGREPGPGGALTSRIWCTAEYAQENVEVLKRHLDAHIAESIRSLNNTIHSLMAEREVLAAPAPKSNTPRP